MRSRSIWLRGMRIPNILSGRRRSNRFRRSALAVVRLSNRFRPTEYSLAEERQRKICPANSWTLHEPCFIPVSPTDPSIDNRARGTHTSLRIVYGEQHPV